MGAPHAPRLHSTPNKQFQAGLAIERLQLDPASHALGLLDMTGDNFTGVHLDKAGAVTTAIELTEPETFMSPHRVRRGAQTALCAHARALVGPASYALARTDKRNRAP